MCYPVFLCQQLNIRISIQMFVLFLFFNRFNYFPLTHTGAAVLVGEPLPDVRRRGAIIYQESETFYPSVGWIPELLPTNPSVTPHRDPLNPQGRVEAQ